MKYKWVKQTVLGSHITGKFKKNANHIGLKILETYAPICVEIAPVNQYITPKLFNTELNYQQ